MRLRIAVLGHQPELLKDVPKSGTFMPINLSKLDIEPQLSSNLLAENRFFLSRQAIELKDSADFVGVVPARWNERFTNWPTLERLPKLENLLTDKTLLAPVARPIDARTARAQREREDLVHPGMYSLLSEVESSGFGHLSNLKGISHSVMANTFIVPVKVYTDFLNYFTSVFRYMHHRYGYELPFRYRCKDCGLESKSGFGRYTSIRHAGYFYERVTCMYFQKNTSLSLFGPNGKKINPEIRIQITKLLPVKLARFTQRQDTTTHVSSICCNHSGWPS